MAAETTRLSKLHPYPAMIADHLAIQISNEYVTSTSRVLDPFCGTGRVLLAAANNGAHCVGLDINPLSSLIVNAKNYNGSLDTIKSLIDGLDRARNARSRLIFDFEVGRKVEWFSSKTKAELSSIITWLNQESFNEQALFLVATILSATVREVSYCRKDQWKLHRMSEDHRKVFYKSAWHVFRRRLHDAYKELLESAPLKGVCNFISGDSRNLTRLLQLHGEAKLFDVIITSPPYGDSQSTVQYGGMSALSMGVIRHLKSLNLDIINSSTIDNNCLGSTCFDNKRDEMEGRRLLNIKKYWHGSSLNPSYEKVHRFLVDMETCCDKIGFATKKGGRAIYVVSRRSTGNWRLYFDAFLEDIMSKNDFSLERVVRRQIKQKITPFLVNKSGTSQKFSCRADQVPTMHSEYILIFRKSAA